MAQGIIATSMTTRTKHGRSEVATMAYSLCSLRCRHARIFDRLTRRRVDRPVKPRHDVRMGDSGIGIVVDDAFRPPPPMRRRQGNPQAKHQP